MREIAYIINDIRETTDNEATNGVSDREIIRHINDCVKTIQSIIFKNNPLCSYFQDSLAISTPISGRAFDLPANCYADNAVSMVEVQSDGSLSGLYHPLPRRWLEDGNSFFGWFTRNKQIVFTGSTDYQVAQAARAWFFKRLPRWDKKWATVVSVASQTITLTVHDSDFSQVDRCVTILTSAGAIRKSGFPYIVASPTTITLVGDLTGVVAGDIIVMGVGTLMTADLPDEVEPFLLDYGADRLYTRNNYAKDAAKIDFWTKSKRQEVVDVFGDIGQSLIQPPITDTSYLEI